MCRFVLNKTWFRQILSLLSYVYYLHHFQILTYIIFNPQIPAFNNDKKLVCLYGFNALTGALSSWKRRAVTVKWLSWQLSRIGTVSVGCCYMFWCSWTDVTAKMLLYFTGSRGKRIVSNRFNICDLPERNTKCIQAKKPLTKN